MSRELFDNLIADFGASIGLDDLTADGEGMVGLLVNDVELHIQFNRKSATILLFARLATIDDDRPQKIYEQLLAANLFWQGTAGATLGIEPVERSVHLCRTESLPSMDLRGITDLIDGFVEAAEYWTAEIARFDPDTADILSNLDDEPSTLSDSDAIRV